MQMSTLTKKMLLFQLISMTIMMAKPATQQKSDEAPIGDAHVRSAQVAFERSYSGSGNVRDLVHSLTQLDDKQARILAQRNHTLIPRLNEDVREILDGDVSLETVASSETPTPTKTTAQAFVSRQDKLHVTLNHYRAAEKPASCKRKYRRGEKESQKEDSTTQSF